MNKQCIISVLSLLTTIFLFVACDEDFGEYQRPVYGAITVSPKTVFPGDSLTLTIPQKSKGNGIAQTTYTWTIKNIEWDEETYTSKDTVISVEDNYDGFGKQDPQLKLLLPENCPPGYHQVTMTATFSVYIGSTLFDKVNVNGNIKVE
ncbi:MAG: hypothetical protein K6A32_01050 [Bacteroidales bacterium]|nr:hypothetical protein [Bacteroidales bacterium]